METRASRLIIVSNRLPYVVHEGEDGQWEVKPGAGGLVSAMAPVLKNRGGVWVGWPGIADTAEKDMEQVLGRLTCKAGYTMQAVSLTTEELDGFYYGFSNEVIWPLFHDFQSRCNFDPKSWRMYQNVNRKYASVIAGLAARDDFIWVHDYHLMLLATELRQLHLKNRLGFFLHIPFPPLDIFLKLPWRSEIIYGLLQYDFVGFQTLRDRRNFLQCTRAMFGQARIESPDIEEAQVLTIRVDHHGICADYEESYDAVSETRLGSFPIGVDYRKYAEHAASAPVAKIASELRSDLRGRKIILGLDRMDYTKGIPNRLAAFSLALRRYPDLIEHVTFVQHAVPSREHIPEYQNLKNDIERRVSEINGKFAHTGWVPVHYMYHDMNFDELVAYYRVADIALVTPLKDGMNLVAKEYCAAQVDEDGVLILSEFAGAAAQLQEGALLVNPYDIEGSAESIYTAITMSQEEKISRMRQLREVVRDSNVFAWVDAILHAALDKNLTHFLIIEDYLPRVELEQSAVN